MAEELGWGAGGVQAFQQYDQQAQLFQQTKQENSLKIEEEGLAVQKGKIELKQQQTFMDALEQREKQKQQSPGPPPSRDPTQARVDQLNDYADIYMSAGQPEKAKDLITAASTLANQHSEITQRQTAEDRAKWGTVASLADGVTDQKSWQQAQMVFQQTHPDWANTPESKKLFAMPYSPQLLDMIKKTSTTQIENAELKSKQASALLSSAEQKQNDARTKLDEAQTKNYESLIKAREKAGGVNLKPSSSDIKTITDLMAEDYGDPADLEEKSRFNNRAIATAERMKDLMRSGIPESRASIQAYQESKQRGAFGGLRTAKVPPGSFEKPMAMPGKPDDLKDNMYYLGKSGQVARWDAASKKFVLPQVERPAVDEGDDPDDNNNPDDDIPAQ